MEAIILKKKTVPLVALRVRQVQLDVQSNLQVHNFFWVKMNFSAIDCLVFQESSEMRNGGISS
jgi:hypothetical protein